MALEQLSHGPAPVDGGTNDVPNGGDKRKPPVDGGDDGNRAARLPRWTRQEILVLIQGKRVAENRVRRGRSVGMELEVEPKWAAASSYCKRHGVNRGAVQCRKRWSNLAGDYKKIKEWESSQVRELETESYWAMRNDLRREKKLPGFFDREVYDVLDCDSVTATAPVEEAAGRFPPPSEVQRTTVSNPLPISGTTHGKRQTNDPGMGAASQQTRKRKRLVADGDEETNTLQSQLLEVLEQNGRMVSEQLESQNTNFQLDREQCRDHVNSSVVVLSKLADALGRIADKL
ncbi:trihelix transcription factor ASR3 isoform X2 [Rhododendron vialii]|uniref:trihelix transcription factor ASR3 isoform X2 n=1 Tax=Rhododendron vialii TaxID=182163 RepID=UPI0026604A46|nr:trihelix transcription factor ASR3 isoform X2 [Rhododendron vialii]